MQFVISPHSLSPMVGHLFLLSGAPPRSTGGNYGVGLYLTIIVAAGLLGD